MSNLKNINKILTKYYNTSFNLDGLEETVTEITEKLKSVSQ